MRALSIAATGMQAQQTNVETIANNLANMNTTGFKQQRAEFEDLLYQNVVTPGAQTSDTGTFAPSIPKAIFSPPAILMTSPCRARDSSRSSNLTAPTPIPARAISRFRRKVSW